MCVRAVPLPPNSSESTTLTRDTAVQATLKLLPSKYSSSFTKLWTFCKNLEVGEWLGFHGQLGAQHVSAVSKGKRENSQVLKGSLTAETRLLGAGPVRAQT